MVVKNTIPPTTPEVHSDLDEASCSECCIIDEIIADARIREESSGARRSVRIVAEDGNSSSKSIESSRENSVDSSANSSRSSRSCSSVRLDTLNWPASYDNSSYSSRRKSEEDTSHSSRNNSETMVRSMSPESSVDVQDRRKISLESESDSSDESRASPLAASFLPRAVEDDTSVVNVPEYTYRNSISARIVHSASVASR